MITIKRASILHLEQLHLLFEEYRTFYHMPANKPQSMAFLNARFKQNDSLIFIAFMEHMAVGFVQIYPLFSSAAMKKIWLLNDLYVNPLARRKGVARKLLTTVENEAKKQSIFSIKLATAVDNHQAKALYHSLDYTTNDQFEHYSKKI